MKRWYGLTFEKTIFYFLFPVRFTLKFQLCRIHFFFVFSLSVSNYLRLHGQENFRSQRGQVPPTPAAPLWLCPCVYEFKWLIITYVWIYNFLFTNHAVTSKNCKKFCGLKLFFQQAFPEVPICHCIFNAAWATKKKKKKEEEEEKGLGLMLLVL